MNQVGAVIGGTMSGRPVQTYWLWDEEDTDRVKVARKPGEFDVIPFDRLREWTEPSGDQVMVVISGAVTKVPKAPLSLMVRRVHWYALGHPGRYPE